MYEVQRVKGKVSCILRLSDGSFIPLSTENRDYVEFLKWHSEQPEENKLDLTDEEPPAKKYDEKRKDAYLSLGLTSDELIIALWENIVEGRSEKTQEIQALRESIKAQFPKE